VLTTNYRGHCGRAPCGAPWSGFWVTSFTTIFWTGCAPQCRAPVHSTSKTTCTTTIRLAFPALVVIRASVRGRLALRGLWNKLLGRAQREAQVVGAVPGWAPASASCF